MPQRKSLPLVSVVIPAYNAAATLVRALDSVFAQDYAPLEVIVIDDGSYDTTSKVAGEYRGGEVRLLSLAENCGVGGAMNQGLAAATGEFVAFLDADDMWLPGKLHRQIERLLDNERASFSSCGCLFLSKNGGAALPFGMPPPGIAKGDLWRALLAKTFVAKPCVVARMSAIRKSGEFDTALSVAEDQDMWIRLAMTGDLEVVEETLVHVFDTPGSLTKIHGKRMAHFVLPMVMRHLQSRRADLSWAETRRIRGERYTSVGRNLYVLGSVFSGGAYILLGIANGYRPLENAWYLFTAAPPVRKLKSAVARREKPVPAAPLVATLGRDVFAPQPSQMAVLPEGPPVLTVVVDTEPEFDWDQPFTRSLTEVNNLRCQEPMQRLFERFGIRPLYAVTYAVANRREGYAPLKEFLDSKVCEIGAHLQPWETPPFVEALSDRTSFVGNLPRWVQREKLGQLTDTIEGSFGVRPVAHKAGRYGIGPATASVLAECGYRQDLSALPRSDLRRGRGPCFLDVPPRPYWFGPGENLLEIPMTVDYVGRMTTTRRLAERLQSPAIQKLHVPGILARMKLAERITLTPEGITLDEMKRLTEGLRKRGQRTFTLSYHSSSMMPGGSPYAATAEAVAATLQRVERYLEYFMGTLGGTAMTPSELYALASAQRRPPGGRVPRGP